jgi:uncharacterized protein (DUF2267 family)
VETPHLFFSRLATMSGISDDQQLQKLVASVLAELRAMVAPGEANYVRQQLPEPVQVIWGPAETDPLSVDFTFPRPDAATLIERVKSATGLADARRALLATFVVLDEALPNPAVVTLLHSVSPSVKQLWIERESILELLKR